MRGLLSLLSILWHQHHNHAGSTGVNILLWLSVGPFRQQSIDWSSQLSLPLNILVLLMMIFSLHFNSHFPGEPGLAGVY